MTQNSTGDPVLKGSGISIYRWLSTLFAREMSPEILNDYRQGSGRAFLRNLSENAVIQPEITRLQTIIQQEKNTSDLALALAGDFGFLFLGAGGPQSVPPYESVYTSEKGTLFQESEQLTRKILEKYGLGVSDNIREPADHIAVQLELLAHLDEISAQKSSTDDAEALETEMNAFLENHLLNWVPEFSTHCTRRDPGGFYAALTRLTVTFLKDTHEQLNQQHGS